jgi:hypothetical protein
MKREEFESLVSSPGWTAFRTFLRDRRADLMEAIAGDHIVVDDREKAIRECMIYKELAEISWEKIELFYAKETK